MDTDSDEAIESEAVFPSETDTSSSSAFTTEESEAYFPSEEDSFTSTAPDATTQREHELIKIAPILISKCCSKECLLNLTASDILKLRGKYMELNQIEQRKWLTDRMYENSHRQGGQLEVKFIVSGMEVCKQAWCEVLSVSSKRVNSILESMIKGQVRNTYLCWWQTTPNFDRLILLLLSVKDVSTYFLRYLYG